MSNDTKLIRLSKGKFALVDEVDYCLAQFKWRYTRDGYAAGKRNGKDIYLHRMILQRMGIDITGLVSDHINRDRLDNRRCNLRACTTAENNRNVGKRSNMRFKGVYKEPSGKWRARISTKEKVYSINYLPSEEYAAAVYNLLAKAVYGDNTYFNETSLIVSANDIARVEASLNGTAKYGRPRKNINKESHPNSPPPALYPEFLAAMHMAQSKSKQSNP